MSRARNNAETRQNQQSTSTMSNYDNRWLRNGDDRDGRGRGGQGLETRRVSSPLVCFIINNIIVY
jgi:hypothetical protein